MSRRPKNDVTLSTMDERKRTIAADAAARARGACPTCGRPLEMVERVGRRIRVRCIGTVAHEEMTSDASPLARLLRARDEMARLARGERLPDLGTKKRRRKT